MTRLLPLLLAFALMNGCAFAQFATITFDRGSYSHESLAEATLTTSASPSFVARAVKELVNGVGGVVLSDEPIDWYPVVGESERRCHASLLAMNRVNDAAYAANRFISRADPVATAANFGTTHPCALFSESREALESARHVEADIAARTAQSAVTEYHSAYVAGRVAGYTTTRPVATDLRSRIDAWAFRVRGDQRTHVLMIGRPVSNNVASHWNGRVGVGYAWYRDVDGRAEYDLVRALRVSLRDRLR